MGQRICLTMIVKNEAKVIARSLRSVKPLITHWCICDTGSTDGTQDIIRKEMEGISGALVEEKWVNFGHNRTSALDHARQFSPDYFITLDADEEFAFERGFALPNLDADAYHVNTRAGNLTYKRLLLLNAKLDWKWVGVLHEYPTIDRNTAVQDLDGITLIVYPQGSRSTDKFKYTKDAALLEIEHKRNPQDPRTVFYLAQSYRDAGWCGEMPREKSIAKAIKFYKMRTRMPVAPSEIWYSHHMIGVLKAQRGDGHAEVRDELLKAHEMNPNRAESPCVLAQFARMNGKFHESFAWSFVAAKIPYPKDEYLFIEHGVYAFGALDELQMAAWHTGRAGDCYALTSKMLDAGIVPPQQIDRIKTQRAYAADAIGKPDVTEQPEVEGKIACLVPTRMRPELLKRMLESWKASSVASDLFFGFQRDDSCLAENISIAAEFGTPYEVFDNIGLVEKSNALVKAARAVGKYKGYVIINDDFVFQTKWWDAIILQRLQTWRDKHNHGFVVPYWRDGINDWQLAPSFATPEMIDAIGGYFPSGYMRHLYVDNFYQTLINALGIGLYIPEIYIEHRHFAVKKAAMDANYAETNSKERYAVEKAAFERWQSEAMPALLAKIKGEIEKASINLPDAVAP